MRTALIAVIIILCVFAILALVCALWVSVMRDAGIGRHDPFFHPFGDMPGFSDQQLREMARRANERIARDPLRRSFVTRDLNSAWDRPPARDADGVGASSKSPRAHAVRNFFNGWRHA